MKNPEEIRQKANKKKKKESFTAKIASMFDVIADGNFYTKDKLQTKRGEIERKLMIGESVQFVIDLSEVRYKKNWFDRILIYVAFYTNRNWVAMRRLRKSK